MILSLSHSHTAGSDYTSVSSRTITFPAGITEVFIPVDTVGDQISEPQESFQAVLTNPSAGLTIGAADTAITSIVDDDGELTQWYQIELYSIPLSSYRSCRPV